MTAVERRRHLSALMMGAVGQFPRTGGGEEEVLEGFDGMDADDRMALLSSVVGARSMGVDLEALRAAFEGGLGSGDGGPKGLTEEEIAALPRSTLHKTSTLLLACTLTVVDGDGNEGSPPLLEMAAIPGDFSPVPPEGESMELVAGEPVTGDAEEFANAGALRGKVVVVRRGKRRFGRMVLMARAAGARGVVVVNSVPLWPYLMKDTVGEVKEAEMAGEEGMGGWFIAIVPQKEGEALLARLLQGEGDGKGESVCVGRMAVTQVEKECVICVETFGEGEEVVRLPACGHGFHAACVQKWLGMARTCPYCRAEVKVRV